MKVSQRNTARPVERPRLDGRAFVCYDLCKHRHKPSPLCFFFCPFLPPAARKPFAAHRVRIDYRWPGDGSKMILSPRTEGHERRVIVTEGLQPTQRLPSFTRPLLASVENAHFLRRVTEKKPQKLSLKTKFNRDEGEACWELLVAL